MQKSYTFLHHVDSAYQAQLTSQLNIEVQDGGGGQGAWPPLGKISAGQMSHQGNTSHIALERRDTSCSQIDFHVE